MMPHTSDPPNEYRLIEQARQALRGSKPERRKATLKAVTDSLCAHGKLARLVSLMASAPEPEMRHLTLLVAARLAEPPSPAFLAVLRHMIAEKDVPEAAAFAVAAALLTITRTTLRDSLGILSALVAGLPKPQAVERLQRLEKAIGKCPAIAEFQARLEDKIKITCPRCGVCLSRPEMIEHLWQNHDLVVDGQSVREPWPLIDEWLEQHRATGDRSLLDRCLTLARRVDSTQGQQRVERLLAAHRADDATKRRSLIAEAELLHASVCPHCYALVRVAADIPLRALNVSRGRLSGGGYRLELSDRGLWTNLEIEKPFATIARSREPGRRLTVKGATLFLSGPFVLLALVLAGVLGVRSKDSLVPVSIALACSALAAAFAQRAWRSPQPLADRAIDLAWKLLVPRFHAEEFVIEDAAFTSSLALASSGLGDLQARSDELIRMRNLTEHAAGVGLISAIHVSPLWRLSVEDAFRAGEDPLPTLVAQADRTLQGAMPLSYLEEFLSGWSPDWLSPEHRARFRVTLCEHAFNSGCEVGDLVEAATKAPRLGRAVGIDELVALASLRVLWSMRSTHPWMRCGAATSAFELAKSGNAGGQLLGATPDLLLNLVDVPATCLCARGLLFQGTLFTEMPRDIEIKPKVSGRKAGFVLSIGKKTFDFADDPGPIADRLERWIRFFFLEFRPLIADMKAKRSADPNGGLLRQPIVRCRKCRHLLRPKIGEVGAPV